MSTRIGATLVALSIGVAATDADAQSARPDSVVGDRVKLLTRGTQWKQVAAIPMGFDTQHPAGHGEDRRRLLRLVGRDQEAHDALSAAGGRLRPRHRRGGGPPVQVRQDRQAPRRPAARRGMRSTTRAASTTTGATSGCRSPSTGRTAPRSSTASTRRR